LAISLVIILAIDESVNMEIRFEMMMKGVPHFHHPHRRQRIQMEDRRIDRLDHRYLDLLDWIEGSSRHRHLLGFLGLRDMIPMMTPGHLQIRRILLRRHHCWDHHTETGPLVVHPQQLFGSVSPVERLEVLHNIHQLLLVDHRMILPDLHNNFLLEMILVVDLPLLLRNIHLGFDDLVGVLLKKMSDVGDVVDDDLEVVFRIDGFGDFLLGLVLELPLLK